MSSSSSAMSSRAQKIGNMSHDIEFKEVKSPDPSVNFVDQFKDAASPRLGSYNEFIINVLPNVVPIMCFILYNVSQLTPSLEASHHAKISAASFAAYCMSIFYGYILACDLYVRPTPSAHATPYAESEYRKLFLEYLLTLPVPEFMQPLLLQLLPSHDESRKNIAFCPSAAGFSYTTHFGRVIPVIMFTAIHDIIAETPSNTARNALMHTLIMTELYTLTTFVTARNNVTVRIGNILGSGMTTTDPASTNAHYYSKVYQIFTAVFNPVIFRDYQRRSVLSSIALEPVTYPNRHMNFYDLMFSASRANLAELRVVFASIAASLNGNVKCIGDLASVFKSPSTSNIMTHGYSEYQLPTWHHATLTSSADTAPRRINPTQYAAYLGFLQAPVPGTKVEMRQPTGTCQTDRTHIVRASFRSWFNLQSSTATDDETPDPTSFILFTEENNLYPRVRVLSPFDQSTVDAWKVTAFGMVIESFEFDGTVIPVPNARLTLGVENSHFADSAIPYRYTIWTVYRANDTFAPLVARARALPERATRFSAASLLVSRTDIFIPQAATQAVPPANQAAAFPGLQIIRDVTWFPRLQMYLGFHTSDNRAHDNNSDSIPGMQTGMLLSWSPYTYVPYESAADYTYTFASNRAYFLTNLRSMFGTRVRLIELMNGLECMPVP